MLRNTAIVPALLVLLAHSPGCKEEPPANEPGEFGEPCIEGSSVGTPDGCADGLVCWNGYCEETCVNDDDCQPVDGWTHECVVGQCQILCGADASCPQTLGTSMECGALMWCVSKDD